MFRLHERLHDFLFRDMWQMEPESRPKRYAFRMLRLVFVLIRELWAGQLNLRAMSLVYTTLLSLVPLLAVSFSVLKAFGVHNQIEPLLSNFLAPLGPEGQDLTRRIVGFVENVRVGVLGSVGLVFLIYTVVTLIQKIEESFNYVWRVHRLRSFSRSFSDYLSVILIGPVLVFSAIGLTASILNNTLVKRITQIEPFGTAIIFAGQVMPYLFVIAAFTFIYIFVPNTRVHLRSALVGGTVAGVLWQTSGFIFASFAASSTQYEALYSSFAIVVLFMIWLYLSWIILLFGSQIAYFHQHPQQVRLAAGRFRLSCRLREKWGLVIMYLITDSYMHGGAPWATDGLVQRLRLPGEAVEDLLIMLTDAGFLLETGEDPVGYIPAHDPDTILVRDLLCSIRSAEEAEFSTEMEELEVPSVESIRNEVNASMLSVVGDMSIKQLVKASS